MGATIYGRNKGNYAPLSIKGSNLAGIEYRLPVASAQVKSSILLAGLFARGETVVYEPNPTRDHTERMLDLLGGSCKKQGDRIILDPSQHLTAKDMFIPGDISSAAYFLVLGAISPKAHIQLEKVGLNPTRTGILDVLEQMHAQVQISDEKIISNEPMGSVKIEQSQLAGTTISGSLIPRVIDEIPVIAVAATQASGITNVRDARELRVKETDRLKAIAGELEKMGADIKEYDDGLTIAGPSRLIGTVVNSHGDHRIAMSLAVAGLIAEGETVIQNAECINISFPEFIHCLEQMCKKERVLIED
jgi:3-phosphoshikimate 1-carboxyvinyltransferase